MDGSMCHEGDMNAWFYDCRNFEFWVPLRSLFHFVWKYDELFAFHFCKFCFFCVSFLQILLFLRFTFTNSAFFALAFFP